MASASMTWGEYREICFRIARFYDQLGDPGVAQYLEQHGAQIQPSEFGIVMNAETKRALAADVDRYLARAVKGLLGDNALTLLRYTPAGKRPAMIFVNAADVGWIDPQRKIQLEQEELQRVYLRMQDIQALNSDRARLGILTPFPVG